LPSWNFPGVGYFWDKVLLFAQAGLELWSASWVAKIVGVSHGHLVDL
jgi:hypothetical protein